MNNRMEKKDHNSLMRCVLVLRFIGIYFQKNDEGTQSESNSSLQPESGQDTTSEFAGTGLPETHTKKSCRSYTCKDVIRVIWYVFINVLYIIAGTFIVKTQNFFATDFTGIIFIIWYLVPTTMVLLSLLTCVLNQRYFSRLFVTLAQVPKLDSKHGRFCNTFDIALILCMGVTRAMNIYSVVLKAKEYSNDVEELTSELIKSVLAYLYFPMFLGIIVSFNFLVHILTRYFKQISSTLEESLAFRSAAEVDTNSLDHAYTSRTSQGVSKSNAVKLLRHIEEALLLIDRGILQITDAFSRILIFLTLMFICDLVFSLYVVATTLQSGNFGVLESLAYGSEALLYLLLIHNPADALSDAEEEFILKLREFFYSLDQEVVTTDPGLHIALLRPRRLSLCNYGNIGRSSFLNTMAFMLSYVVVTIQFSGATGPA